MGSTSFISRFKYSQNMLKEVNLTLYYYKMGNAIEKNSTKLLVHPHLDEQISQAFEHGNPTLIDVSSKGDWNFFPVISPTPPPHAYMYLCWLTKSLAAPEPPGYKPGSGTVRMLTEHPSSMFAYIAGSAITHPSTDDKLKNTMLNYKDKDQSQLLGELIIELIGKGGIPIAEMTKLYPIDAPTQLTDSLTDDQLYWLMLARRNISDMEVSSQQKPRLLAAMVKADLYVHYDQLDVEDLVTMLPDILIRWHHLRNVASNYLIEVLAPYYFTLFQFMFEHNFLNKISQADANLLTLVYPELLGDEPEKWCEGPAHQRSVKCLSHHTLYHMVCGNIIFSFFHPTNKQVWHQELSEILDAEEPPTQDIDRWGYYGSLWCNRKCDTDILDGNDTDLIGTPISHYNTADVVVIYDAGLTTQYYITRAELPKLIRTKVNPYNQEIIPDLQLIPYQLYLDWHRSNVMPAVTWKHQWRILKYGRVILPNIDELDELISYYINSGDLPYGTLSADGTYKFEIDVNALDSMDKEEMTDIITQANHEIDRVYDNDPAIADGLKGIMGGIAQIMVLADDSGKRIKGTGESSDNPRIKQIED